MRHALTGAIAIAGLLQASGVAAGTMQTTFLEIDEGNAIALLETTSQYYVDAMRNVVMDRFPEEHRAIRWETLETSISRKTVARFEYRYTLRGVDTVRVYVAIDGAPFSTVASEIFGGPTRPPTPDTPSPPTRPSSPDTPSPEPATDMSLVADQAELDANDNGYFPALDDATVRARIQPGATSRLQAFDVDGSERGLDAEFKIARSLEADIAGHVVPAGGTLQGFVSNTSCLSCRNAMKRLADLHGIDVRITQLRPGFSVARQQALLRSGVARLRGNRLVSAADGSSLLAHDQLVEARAIQARQSLSPRVLNRGFKGRLWRQRSLRLRIPRVSDVAEEVPAGSAPPETEAPPSMEPLC